MPANIDVRETIQRLDDELAASPAENRRNLILAILERWQNDPDLSPDSREAARAVLRRHRGSTPRA